MPSLRAPLPSGPLDLVGDIHGEIDALLRVLHRLGCDPERRRSRRRLVFVGDLIDRGPDSPACVELVMRLVEAGMAQVVLGNHELNLLRGEHKEGNGGCLVLNKEEIAAGGVMLYLNANGRIRDAVGKVVPNGGSVIQDTHAIGPHGFRAIVLDSEGNRIALHSETDA